MKNRRCFVSPKVTFIVPCYKLAHLLPECVESILAQSFQDFEILIMDDCSPDNTPGVARSFTDPRVRHIRNEPNLGNSSNYNKGIALAKGKYVWLISADDRLRRPYVLERYVRLMEAHPEVGLVCCPAMELKAGMETGVEHGVAATRDTIFKGHDFAEKLSRYNCVVVASVMVRKTCYDRFGGFPLDLGYAGDWYLWCLFALHSDVAYFAEPMTNYRMHENSMTTSLMNGRAHVCAHQDLLVLWRIARAAVEAGHRKVASAFKKAIATEYARQLTTEKFGTSPLLSEAEFEQSLAENAGSEREVHSIRARVHAHLGDYFFHQQNPRRAAQYYSAALREGTPSARTFIKCLLSHAGPAGVRARQAIFGLRHCY
jgi:glycosyltransferase involved in cell wall biosynthesis